MFYYNPTHNKLIDYLKITVKDLNTIKYFENHHLPYFCSKSEFLLFNSEVIAPKEVRQYKGILFVLREINSNEKDTKKELDILFKPHYYFNNNKHNGNDFTALNSINVITEFIKTFGITKSMFKFLLIKNIEYGVNFILEPYNEELISFLGYHSRNEFRADTGLRYSKKAFSFNKKEKANRYLIVKFYWKGIQFPNLIDKRTLRFEIKSCESARVKNELKISNIGGLLNFNTYLRMKKDILKEVKKVLIYDNLNRRKRLNKRELKSFDNYTHQYTWYNALQRHRNVFTDKKQRYFKLLDKTGFNIHTELEKVVKSKLNHLTETRANSTPLIKNETRANSNNSIVRICTSNNTKKPVRKCAVTGVNISMQKEESKLLSHTGLKYYLKTDKKIFDEVVNKYLPKTWIGAKSETQIKELAHNIRNKYYNRNRNINPLQTGLF